MSYYKKFFSNPYLYRQFSNNAGEIFDFTMNNLMDSFYDSQLNKSTEGSFKAIVLSGIRTEDGGGSGTEPGDASIEGKYLYLTVRPLTTFGEILSDPLNFSSPSDVIQCIALHTSVFRARSDFEFKDHKSIQFGQIVNCYFEEGSINNSDFSTLRFSEPNGVVLDEDYLALAALDGLASSQFAFENTNPSLMANMANGITAGPSASQQEFEEKLQAAITAKGLQFYVTDRARTVDDQMNRIMNKYKGNGKSEVISTYGSNRGAAMVKAIESGDMATLRTLASKSSRHLKGAAIDIRSWHYTDAQMTVVLAEIRRLGGNPLVEPVKPDNPCWTNRGRDVTSTSRAGNKAGGDGKGTPCYNEHIHIDIPISSAPAAEQPPTPPPAPPTTTVDPVLTIEQLKQKYAGKTSYQVGNEVIPGKFAEENGMLYFYYTVSYTEEGLIWDSTSERVQSMRVRK